MEQYKQFNCGEQFGEDIIIGLYHPESEAIAAHGAFVATKLPNEEMIRVCTFHTGIQFPALCPSEFMLEKQVTKLLEEGWQWMTSKELYVCCCGMSFPGQDQPFWTIDIKTTQEEMDKLLVINAASGNADRVCDLLNSGADPMYCDGLSLIVAASNKCSNIIHLLVCGGVHGEALKLASKISTANDCIKDAQYLTKWYNMDIMH
jgi:hypothetical protein